MTTYTAFIQPRADMAVQIADGIGRFASRLVALRKRRQPAIVTRRTDCSDRKGLAESRSNVAPRAGRTVYRA